MTARGRKKRYQPLRPHAARVIKLGEFPTHVNGAYMDDPERIPVFDLRQAKGKG